MGTNLGTGDALIPKEEGKILKSYVYTPSCLFLFVRDKGNKFLCSDDVTLLLRQVMSEARKLTQVGTYSLTVHFCNL